ncbi:MAG: D-TA family PLP-dependent enzyme [Sedimentibacter sp.]
MNYKELDTPALIVDKKIMMENIRSMQSYANRNNVSLRPHTKTHKMPYIAIIQEQCGAKGITVAKVGEAEVMAENGLKDIFIANEIVGTEKFKRIRALSEKANISFGIDSIPQVEMVEKAFENADKKAVVLIEIEVGENRSGIIEDNDFIDLIKFLKSCKNIVFQGIFSHEGHSYSSASEEECFEMFMTSQKRTLSFARLAEDNGLKCNTVSIGATPTMMHDFPILPGITEIRPGTYVFMDASQGNHISSYSRCAATVMTTVISKPTSVRVITDVGAKGITMQTRSQGMCATKGLGVIKNYNNVNIDQVYDEHAIIYNKMFHDSVNIGDKIEIIPNHICPVVNLHEEAYFIDDGEVLEIVPILCRGKLK